MDRYIETEILFYNVKNENLGLANVDKLEKALIDLNSIHSFAVYSDRNNCIQLYNEFFEALCVVNIDYNTFKGIFLAYKTSLINVLNN
jgi:hypothetical protein